MRRALSVVVVSLGLGVSLPVAVAGGEEASPKIVLFAAEGSNGYGLVVLAVIPPKGEENAPKGEEGEEGEISIFVVRRDGQAIYGVPATVTRRTIEADLGGLGRISLTRVVTDRMKTVRRGCKPGRTKRIRAQRYEGTIEFHGEEGFTEVNATSAPITYLPVACFLRGGRARSPRTLPGARLDADKRRRDDYRIEFDAKQLRPGAKTAVSAEVDERRGEVAIHRSSWTSAPASALRYDRHLRTATVKPPAPFSGHGTYRRNARPANRWTGNLKVDFPGRSNVRLTGRSFDADLERPTR